MIRFCIHGIFRSGTNFARGIFEMNYDCEAEYDSFGWKHAHFPILSAASRIDFPEIPSVFVIRNPFLALSSLQSYAARNDRNIRSRASEGMSAFLGNPLVIFDGGAPVSAELYFASPIELWNSMNWNYLSTVGKQPGRVMLRYEDLVARPEETAERVAAELGLKRRAGPFQVPEKRMRNLGSNMHDTGNFMRKKAFDMAQTEFSTYAAVFSEQDRALVLDGANADLVERAGYGALMAKVRAGEDPDAA